jgi:hypothetical protein
MSSRMPPVPPGNRSKKTTANPSKSDERGKKAAEYKSVKQSEQRRNSAEEGETANIKQNTTNKGFYRGRRMG